MPQINFNSRDEFARLHPRVKINIGMTLKAVDQFEFIKPEIGMEIDVPAGLTANETYDQLYDHLAEQFSKLVDQMQRLTGG